MSTKIRSEVSTKNKYWIPKHRYYELKHYCLQYPTWKRAYLSLDEISIQSIPIDEIDRSYAPGDPTGKKAVLKAYYEEKIRLVEDMAKETDPYLNKYILKAVTEELSYNYLQSKLNIPCGRDMYYDRYRKFFWLLSRERD